MTIDQFNNTRFGKGMKVKYWNEIYFIKTVDFIEELIGIVESEDAESDEISWVRCENCDLIEE